MLLSRLLAFCLLLISAVQAENATHFNDYSIHHNAITTDSIAAQVAKVYNIQRSRSQGLINIAIVKHQEGTIGNPVAAEVTVKARNLFGQQKDFELQEIREDNAIYYIGVFPIAHKEQFIFDIEAKPADMLFPLKAQLRHQFYID